MWRRIPISHRGGRAQSCEQRCLGRGSLKPEPEARSALQTPRPCMGCSEGFLRSRVGSGSSRSTTSAAGQIRVWLKLNPSVHST